MRKHIPTILISLTIGLVFTFVNITVTVLAADLSAFTSTQQYQLENWWGEKWSAFYDGNFSVQDIPNTGVIREEGTGTVYVRQILVKNSESNEQVTITPQGIECLDSERQPKLCQIPLP